MKYRDRRKLAAAAGTPKRTLMGLARVGGERVALLLAAREGLPAEVAEVLLGRRFGRAAVRRKVARELARRGDLPEALQAAATAQAGSWGRWSRVQRAVLPPGEAQAAWWARRREAADPLTDPERLKALARDPSAAVRLAVAGNWLAGPEVYRVLINDPSREVKQAAALSAMNWLAKEEA